MREASGRTRARGLRRIVNLILLLPVIGLVLLLSLALVYSALTPPSTLMLGRWLTLHSVDRQAVGLEAISPYLVQAVIASEDQRYCLHNGVDWGALRDVVDDEEGPSRGASTIPMQTVKNVFLWPSRDWVRKGLEAGYTVLIETVWSKRRIMEVYLNVVEWAPGVYGAQAASRHWFGKDARDLSPREAARLAAILPAPRRYEAAAPGPYVRRRAARVQAAMGAVRNEGLNTCVVGR